MAKGKLIKFTDKPKNSKKIAEIIINNKGQLGINVKTKISRLDLINILQMLQGMYIEQEILNRQKQKTGIVKAQINPNNLSKK